MNFTAVEWPRRWSALALILVLCLLHRSPPVMAQDADAEPDTPKTVARQFIELLDGGEYKSATKTFDATMSQVVSADRLKQIWEATLASSGEFEKQGDMSQAAAGPYAVVLVNSQFSKTNLTIKVVVDKQLKVAGLFFLPAEPNVEYQPPSYGDLKPIQEMEVEFGSSSWELPGTLALPRTSEGKLPAVILVHGSGPGDRDESVGAAKPFKDLSIGLASSGIAVLRYDKRTRVYSSRIGADQSLTVRQETVEDAVAAAKFLNTRTEIDPKRIFVVGHSLGGYLIPRIAAADSAHSIAGFVSLAGNTRPLPNLILEQTGYLLQLDGNLSKSDQQQIEQLKQQIAKVNSVTAQSPPVLGAPAAYWLDLRDYQPDQEAKALKRPLLILQGERDYQVTMVDFANWQKALSGRSNVTFKSYPALNHLMIAGNGKSTPSEYEQAGNVAKDIIDDIAAWIDKH